MSSFSYYLNATMLKAGFLKKQILKQRRLIKECFECFCGRKGRKRRGKENSWTAMQFLHNTQLTLKGVLKMGWYFIAIPSSYKKAVHHIPISVNHWICATLGKIGELGQSDSQTETFPKRLISKCYLPTIPSVTEVISCSFLKWDLIDIVMFTINFITDEFIMDQNS